MGASFVPEKQAWLQSYFGLPDPSAAEEAQAPQADDAQGAEMEENRTEPTRTCRYCQGTIAALPLLPGHHVPE